MSTEAHSSKFAELVRLRLDSIVETEHRRAKVESEKAEAEAAARGGLHSGAFLQSLAKIRTDGLTRITDEALSAFQSDSAKLGRESFDEFWAQVENELQSRLRKLGQSAEASVLERADLLGGGGGVRMALSQHFSQQRLGAVNRAARRCREVKLSNELAQVGATHPPAADTEFARMAIEEARKSRPEPGAVRPRVGAVVVKDGKVLARAHRNELKAGEHAEFTALEGKLSGENLTGCVVYTTLEPCTSRGHPKVPCAQRLIERRVARVVIGMLDPNPEILGRGVWKLREAGIEVAFFGPSEMAEVEELDRDFVRAHRTLSTPHDQDSRRRLQLAALILILLAAAATATFVLKSQGAPNRQQSTQGPELSDKQLALLKLLDQQQRAAGSDKLIIGRSGELMLYGDVPKSTGVDLAAEIFGSEPDHAKRSALLQRLVETMPADVLRQLPESRFDSPYVVSVTPQGRAELGGNAPSGNEQ